MKPWKVILATLVIFGTGVLTGGFLVNHAHRDQERPARRESPMPHGGPKQGEFIKRMERELNLTPEQREKIKVILNESQQRTKAIWEPIAPQMRDELKRSRDLIRAELTEAQREKFEELFKSRPRNPDEMEKRPRDGKRPEPSGDEPRPGERPPPPSEDKSQP